MFICINQSKLRAEKYIYLQDSLRNDEGTENLGCLVVIPTNFSGGRSICTNEL